MADTTSDNTEQLVLDTSDAQRKLSDLLVKIQNLRRESTILRTTIVPPSDAFKNLSAGLQNVRSQVTALGTAMNKLTGGGGNGSYGSLIAGRLASYTAVGAGLAGILGTVREVVALDNELKNIQAITKASDASMVALRGRILDVATSSKFMSTEVAAAAVSLGQAGLSANQIGDALKSVTQLAAGSGSSLTEAVNIVTSALGAFNLNAGETANVANLFTAALNNSKLTMEQLSQGFTYSANAAAQLGVSYEELTGLLASLSDAGIKSGSTLGTGLRALFVGLTDPSEKLTKTLGRLGISLDDLDLHTHSAIGVIRQLHDAGFTTADAFSTLETRAAAAFAALVGQIDGFGTLQRSIIGTSAASEAAATQMGSLANTARQTASILTAIGSTSFQPIVSGIQTVLAGTNSWLKSLTTSKGVLEGIGVAAAAVTARIGVGFLANVAGATRLAALVSSPAGLVGAVGFTALLAFLGSAKDKMAGLTAAVEDAKGKNEAARTSYQEVEKAIGDLLAKEQSLKANKDDLKTTTVELGERFRALGLDVNGLEGDFDGLLSKLKQLDTTQRDALKGSLDLLAAKQGQELQGLQASSAGVTGGLRLSVFGNVLNRETTNPGSKYTSGGATNFGSFKPGSAVDRFLVRLSSGGPLTADDFPTVQAAAAEAARGNVGGGLAAAIDTALQFTAQLRTKQDAEKATLASAGAVQAQSSTAFQSLEETSRLYYSQLSASVPKRIADDPVKTEAALSGWINAHKGEINQLDKAYKAFGSQSPENAAAVSQSTARQQVLGLLDQVQGNREGVRDDAKKFRAELAGLTADAMDEQLSILRKEIQRSETPDELRDAASKALTLLPEVFEKQASEFLQKQGFSPDEFAINKGTFSARITGHSTEIQRAQLNAFTSKFKNGALAETNDAVNAKADALAKDFLSDQLTTIKLGMSAIERKVRDAFKNVDEYTPASDIRDRASQALDNLAEWYLAALDQLDKQVKLEKLSPAQAADRLNSLSDEYSSRHDEITDRTKALKYDYSRPLGANSDPYENIRKALAGPPKGEDFANTFSSTMVGAITEVRQNFSGMFSDILTGQTKALDGFKGLAKGILQSMLSVINDSIARSFLKFIGKIISAGTPEGGDVADTSGGDVPGHVLGGTIRRYAGGGANRDSVLARLTPGEFVFRRSAVEAIGRDNLENLNAMGNTRRTAASMPKYEKAEPILQNFYIVQKDRVPQIGKNDILMTVADDVLQGGMTKKLIRSVAAGH